MPWRAWSTTWKRCASSAPIATTSSTSPATVWKRCSIGRFPRSKPPPRTFPRTSAPPTAIEPLPPAPAVVTVAPVGTGIGGFEATGDEIDDEIREVFLEEFEEEIGHLEQMLPGWRATPEDMEKLRPIRRVFHTLKGSGPLVGARTLGEFSWKVENMLILVLMGRRPP